MKKSDKIIVVFLLVMLVFIFPIFLIPIPYKSQDISANKTGNVRCLESEVWDETSLVGSYFSSKGAKRYYESFSSSNPPDLFTYFINHSIDNVTIIVYPELVEKCKAENGFYDFDSEFFKSGNLTESCIEIFGDIYSRTEVTYSLWEIRHYKRCIKEGLNCEESTYPARVKLTDCNIVAENCTIKGECNFREIEELYDYGWIPCSADAPQCYWDEEYFEKNIFYVDNVKRIYGCKGTENMFKTVCEQERIVDG